MGVVGMTRASRPSMARLESGDEFGPGLAQGAQVHVTGRGGDLASVAVAPAHDERPHLGTQLVQVVVDVHAGIDLAEVVVQEIAGFPRR